MFLIIPLIFFGMSFVVSKADTSYNVDKHEKTINKFNPAKPRGI